MKLYLDDIRNPHQSGYQDSEWIVCRNDKTFKDMFISFDNIITHISFDHDIDSTDENGEYYKERDQELRISIYKELQ